jgi:hypothetical protein
MPRFADEIKPLLDQAFLDLQTAWPDCEAYKGAPRTQVQGNFATLEIEAVPSEFGTVRQVQMAVSFTIVGYFEIVAGENVEEARIERLDALASVYEASETYYDLANNPMITNADFPNLDDKDMYAVRATFSCLTFGAWGNDAPA